jgi:plastocyanin
MKKTQGGLVAAVVAIAAAGGVGVAAAHQLADAQVYGKDAGGPCFSTTAGTDCTTGETAEVSINTGEKVTWNFDGNVNHNAAAANDVPADPTWKDYSGDFVTTGSYSRTFTQPGDYQFLCQAHPAQMTGVIHVTGDPVETPTSTPTTTPSATPTPTPTTHPGGSTTPPPTPTEDTVKPRVRSLKLKALRHAARVTFRLSEPSTVTIRVRRGHKVVKTVRKQVAAGKRTVTIRSKKLKKGRYTIVVLARDAFGNRSVAASKSLRIKR